jgi:hypothetical protein
MSQKFDLVQALRVFAKGNIEECDQFSVEDPEKNHVASLVADMILKLEAEITKPENMVDNAHSALEAVKCSGSITDDDVFEMIELGFDSKPQNKNTRLS